MCALSLADPPIPDDTALFASVQHSGDGLPRPSVVVITAAEGIARIGAGPADPA